MTQPARERALGRFAAGANDVLVATDVAAEGLDLERHVIDFDPPPTRRTTCRVGRTARAGRSRTGITFVTREKRRDVGKVADVLQLQAEFRDAGFRLDVQRPAQPQSRRASGVVASIRDVRGEVYAPKH